MGRRRAPNVGTPWIADGVLHISATPSDAAEMTICVDSDEWYAWLSTATKFYVYDKAGNFTVRKTARQRGGLYWTARRYHQGRLVQVHIGLADALTGAQLAAVPARLTVQLKVVEGTAQSTQDVPGLLTYMNDNI